ncbi:MAG: hypothetical protein ACI4IX_06240 [Acutalibacteraceae bacterium]
MLFFRNAEDGVPYRKIVVFQQIQLIRQTAGASPRPTLFLLTLIS